MNSNTYRIKTTTQDYFTFIHSLLLLKIIGSFVAISQWCSFISYWPQNVTLCLLFCVCFFLLLFLFLILYFIDDWELLIIRPRNVYDFLWFQVSNVNRNTFHQSFHELLLLKLFIFVFVSCVFFSFCFGCCCLNDGFTSYLA